MDIATDVAAGQRPDAATVHAIRPRSASVDLSARVTGSAGELVLRDGEMCTVGSSSSAALRIGRHDPLVAPLSFQLAAWRGRVLVSNLDPQLALVVHAVGRPAVSLAPGATYGPDVRPFDVLVEGTFRHVLRVEQPAWSGTGGEGRRIAPRLTARQRQVVECYCEPLRAGQHVPRSHQAVADRLHLSYGTVRQEMDRIWTALADAGVPLHALSDRRDEVVWAWLLNRLG